MSKRRPNDRDRPGYFLPEDRQFRPAPMDGASGEGSARPCYTFGITLAQVDALARLVQAVSAHGDVVAVGPMGDLAKGTLPQLGQAICDAADALRALLDQVEGQRIGAPARPRVSEARAAYCVVPVDGGRGRLRRGQAVARRGVALGFAGVEFDFAAVRAVPARDLFHPLLAAADLVQ